MDDRKGKGIMKYESHDSPPGSAQRAWERPRTGGRDMAGATAAHAHEDGTRSAGVQGPADPRQPPPGRAAFRCAGDQPAARPPDETAARRSARMELFPSGRHGVQGQAQGSAIRPSPPMVCPMCHCSFFFDSAICVFCVCAAAAAAQNLVPLAPPGAIPIPEGQRCPACRSFPGRVVDAPWWHVCRCDVCRFFRGWPCPECASPQAGVQANMGLPPPKPQHQHPLALNSSGGDPLHPSAPACSSSRTSWQDGAVRRPEGTPPDSGGTASSRDSGHVQCSPATSPWDRVARPRPAAPVHDDGWCPACLYRRAPWLSEPREHVCVCDTCIHVYREVCNECASFDKDSV